MNVSITFSHLGVPYGIYPGVGDFNDIVIFTQPIPVLADFNLFAYMTCELTSPRQSEAKDRLVCIRVYVRTMYLHTEGSLQHVNKGNDRSVFAVFLNNYSILLHKVRC
jgi:hypothetical protein